jgi:cobalt-zinc-cadmium resistance protein CzcA
MEIEVAQASADVTKGEMKPEFSVGYFIHSIKGAQTINGREIVFDGLPRFQAINFGLSLPVFAGSYKSRIKAADQKVLQLNAEADQYNRNFEAEVAALKQRYFSHQAYLSFFQSESIPNGEMIASNAIRSYESGDIGYVEYTQALETQFEIEQAYLEAIRMNNQLVIQLQFLLNQQGNNNE